MLWISLMPCSSPGTSLCFKTQTNSVNMCLRLTPSLRFSMIILWKGMFWFFLHFNILFRAINSKCFFIKNWNEEMIYFLVWLISVCEILFYKSFYEFVRLKFIFPLFSKLTLQTIYEWQVISNLLPKSDSESLKYKWFSLISSVRSPEWSDEDDYYLISILRFFFILFYFFLKFIKFPKFKRNWRKPFCTQF